MVGCGEPDGSTAPGQGAVADGSSEDVGAIQPGDATEDLDGATGAVGDATGEVSADGGGDPDADSEDAVETSDGDATLAPDDAADSSGPTDASEDAAKDASDAAQTTPDTAEDASDSDVGVFDAAADGGGVDAQGPDAVDAAATDSSADAGAFDIEFSPTGLPLATVCDAGDAAWAARAVWALLGRPPRGAREIKALVSLIKATSRGAVAKGLMADPGFVDRWRVWLLDVLMVSRALEFPTTACFDAPSVAGKTTSQLAIFVRDNGPTVKWPGSPAPNFRDLVDSSLELDDISVPFIARPMTLMRVAMPYCPNVSLDDNDTTYRRFYGAAFTRGWMHRDVDCIGCHNAAWSTTDDPDPKKDRFWPLIGNFEKAVFGAPAGKTAMQHFAPFRMLHGTDVELHGVPLPKKDIKDAIRPWGFSVACGHVFPTAKMTKDTLVKAPYLGGDLGDNPSIWQVESLIRAGADAARGKKIAPTESNPDLLPADAAGALLATRIAHELWKSLVGRPLTVAHGFPRNKAQRDLLQELSWKVSSSKFSLKETLETILTMPHFNLAPPGDACAGATFKIAPVFDPFSREFADPEDQVNSVGDAMRRRPARELLSGAHAALGWTPPQDFGSWASVTFQGVVGAFVSLVQRGFDALNFQAMLYWESRYGMCVQPLEYAAPTPGVSQKSCVGRCGSITFGGEPGVCSCDSACAIYKDCCADFVKECKQGSSAASAKDWMSALLATATAQGSTATIRDLMSALKDRLITDPVISDGEEAAAIAKLFGVANVDVPLTQVTKLEERARVACGALLKSPDFVLAGLPPPAGNALPSLVIDGQTVKAACELWAPRVLPTQNYACTELGVSILP